MANKKPRTSKDLGISALIFLFLSIIGFYIGNRFMECAISLSGRNGLLYGMDAATNALPSYIAKNPVHLDISSVQSVVGGLVVFLTIWIIWAYMFAINNNFRFGEEAGSARWGTLQEGQAFKDLTNSDNNLLFTKNYGLALKKPKFDQATDRNLNVLVVGGSGSGKTRYYVKPNLLQLNSSYFVTDPKGTLIEETGYLFRENGYDIRVFNCINFASSMHYNPLKYVETDADILSFVNCLIKNTNDDKKSGGDQFWENAERLLYTALIAFMRDWLPPEDYSLPTMLDLLAMAEAKEEDENFKSGLDILFSQIETGYIETYSDEEMSKARGTTYVPKPTRKPSDLVRRDGVIPAECGGLQDSEDFALSNYKAFRVASGKTLKSIIISCNVRVKPLAIKEVRELLSYDEMNLDTLGDEFVTRPILDENGIEKTDSMGKKLKEVDKTQKQRRSIVYGILSDTDRTFSFLFAIMMWQCMDQLCRKALDVYGGKLPNMVNFIFDEFANIGTVPDIEKTIAVTRSRNIGLTIILQSLSQLEARYDKDSKTIVDCCDTTLFLGSKSLDTCKEIAEMIGKETIHTKSFGASNGQSPSTSSNQQTQARDLIDPAEIARMDRRKAILMIAGTYPLMDFKYPLENHMRYKYIDPGSRHTDGLFQKPFDFEQYKNGNLEDGLPEEYKRGTPLEEADSKKKSVLPFRKK